MKIRRPTEADLPRIVALQNRAENAAHFDPEDYFRYECRIAGSDSDVLGFILWRRVADDESEILNLVVAAEFRRQGLARSLVQMQLSEQQGHCFLEVRESNVAARNLYKQLGFSEIGVRPKYYSDPSETAIVMSIRS